MTDTLTDHFNGRPDLSQLSARIASGERASDEEVATALTPTMLDPFRLVARCLAGRVRKVTGEPSLSHSVDVALRATLLGFSEEYILACLLHDIVEESSRTLEDVAVGLEAIRNRFGEEVARDVRVLTNRYSIIFENVAPRVEAALPFELESLAPVRDEIFRLQRDLPEAVQREFAEEFPFLLDYFYNRLLEDVKLDCCRKRARLNYNYTFVSELTLQAYHVYIVELADDACKRLDPQGTRFYDRALVVKGMDMVDNQRTTPVTSTNIERAILKAEIWLDRCYYLNDWLRCRQHRTTFENLYEYVKLQTIQQLIERKLALKHLGDTRFELLAQAVESEIVRLREKYRVEGSPVLEIRRLTGEIQAHNQNLATTTQ
ncbi:MAG: HD domain-containing protein [Deltaproteobacteria bacterium]|nr:HD domain-containing protein [Deltaproteobacteria bacterium]